MRGSGRVVFGGLLRNAGYSTAVCVLGLIVNFLIDFGPRVTHAIKSLSIIVGGLAFCLLGSFLIAELSVGRKIRKLRDR